MYPLARREVDHPFSLAYAQHFAAVLHRCRHDAPDPGEDPAFAPETEHGLLGLAGAVHRGWGLAERGQVEEGLAQMREAVAALRKLGAELRIPFFLALIAEVHVTIRRPEEGLQVVSDAFAAADRSGQHFWTAELHRLRGVLTLQSPTTPGRDTEAEASITEALRLARRQGARSLELRAATTLARLWASQGRASEARALLSEVYGWFTEGFDTADLAEARSLLAEIGAPGRRPRR